MKTFDLELRVITFGSIITWKVFLEDSTNDNNIVRDWLQGEDFRFKKFPNYQIDDDSLEVFSGCHGILGGNISCEVVINGIAQAKKVVAKVDDRIYSKGSFKII
jgi:hypothetical protein